MLDLEHKYTNLNSNISETKKNFVKILSDSEPRHQNLLERCFFGALGGFDFFSLLSKFFRSFFKATHATFLVFANIEQASKIEYSFFV